MKTNSFAIGFLLISAVFAVDNPSVDYFGKYYDTKRLYDTTDVFQNPDLQPALEAIGYPRTPLISGDYVAIDMPTLVTLNDVRDALEDSFLRNRRSLYLWAIGKEVVAGLFIPLIIAGIAVGVSESSISGVLLSGSLIMMQAVYVFATSLYGPKTLITGLINSQSDPLMMWERKYARHKLEINFLDWEQDQLHGMPYPEQLLLAARKSPETLLSVFAYFRTLLSVPLFSRQPVFNQGVLEEKLSLYAPEQRRVLMACCLNHARGYKTSLGVNDREREFVTLVASPGTGKSKAIENVAESMDLASVTVCVAGATEESLFGSQTTPGLILEKLVELGNHPRGSRNGFFAFDELDKVMDWSILSVLLPFLEPSYKKFYSKYLQRHIDVSHLFCVAIVNQDFTAPILTTLKSRFHALKTVDLTIINRPLFLQMMGEYANRNGATVPITAILEAYLGERPLSFRDAQNFITLEIAKRELD